jgi:hypothetical protein
MVSVLLVVAIVTCSLWVYWDATGNKIGKVPGAGGLFNMSAGAWATVTMFLWIIAFPSYVIKRSALIEVAKSHAVDVKGRLIKTLVLGFIGALWVLFVLAGTMVPSTR